MDGLLICAGALVVLLAGRLLRRCAHRSRVKETREGVLHLVCLDCGDAVRAISRGPRWNRSGVLSPRVHREPKQTAPVTSIEQFRRVR